MSKMRLSMARGGCCRFLPSSLQLSLPRALTSFSFHVTTT